jgi:hypothetical protein
MPEKDRPAIDTRAVAERLIAHLGEQAPCQATYEALKARRRGDATRMDEWLWIAGATREILRSEP